MKLNLATLCLVLALVLAATRTHVFNQTLDAGESIHANSDRSFAALIYNATGVTQDTIAEVNASLKEGLPVVFIGEGAERLLDLAEPPLTIENMSDVVIAGIWRHPDEPGNPVSILLVRDAFYSSECLEAANKWFTRPVDAPSGNLSEVYRLIMVLTELDRNPPLGVLETRTEVLKVLGGPGSDTYDLIVYQKLTSGSTTGLSGWKWSSLEYALDGSAHGANIELLSYDEPPRREPPVGIFTLLWRIVTLRWADLIPWLKGEQSFGWTDMSDYGKQLYHIRIETPDDSPEASNSLEARHHVVLRVAEGADPIFLRWTQVRYVKGGVLSVERYTAPAIGGLIQIHP